MSLELIREQVAASIAAKQDILADEKLINQIHNLALQCLQCLKGGGKIIFAGNGGSFADAQHLSAEFICKFMFDRAPLASIVLGANNSAISAIGNDYGYQQVFARELKGLARAGDLFIPISTSGNSPSILQAIEQAVKLQLPTIALAGASGGQMAALCECLCAPSTDTARIQECHIVIGHIICCLVDQKYFPEVS